MIDNMKHFIKIATLICCVCLFASCTENKPTRLLYWNIQNGMWSGQGDNYDQFVNWVKAKDPDICVWCEAQSIYITGTADAMPAEDRYLVEGWGELAKRYGHDYWYIGGYRDDYPQVITSKYPISDVKKIIGAEPDSVVTHGAGWARIEIGGEVLNIVTLHTWPQAYTFRAKDREVSRAKREGDWYRKMEMEYICNATILSESDASAQNWMMMGDFNSQSRVDNYIYKYSEDDSRFLVHDYIAAETPYIDIIAKIHPNVFKTTTGREKRIDFVYCTAPVYEGIVTADVITDDYTKPIRDPQNLSNFWHPSDHRPIIVDFRLK